MRVLVVDDLPDIAHMTAMILNLSGHVTWVATSGHQAMALAMEREFDACLLDISMPDVSGLEVARFIRQLRGEGPKLLAVTGYGNRAMRVQCLDAGFDYHVAKPVDCRKLTQLIER